MKALFAAMRLDKNIADICKAFAKIKHQSFIYGLSDAPKHAVMAAAYEASPRPWVIIASDGAAVAAWKEDLAFLLPQAKVVELPEVDQANFTAVAKSVELMAKRMDVLGCLMRHEPVIVLSTAAAAVQKGMSRQDFSRLSLSIKLGDILGRDELIKRLTNLGYEHAPEVERMGQYSARGGIVDVFPINLLRPIRIDFFDDEIDSLREFDMESMRSTNNISEVSVLPLADTDASGRPELFLSYLEGNGVVEFDEPMRVRENIRQSVRENPEIKAQIFTWEEMVSAAADNNVLFSALMLQKVHDAEPDAIYSVVVKAVVPYQKQFDMFTADVKEWYAGATRQLILLGDDVKCISMREMLAKNRIPSVAIPRPESLDAKAVSIAEGALSGGFELPGANLVVMTEKDIFGHQKKKRRIISSQDGNKITHFREIHAGDYVVHVNHGIGKYLGVVTLDVGGVKRDYLHIKYGGEDKLFVPTDQVSLLQKYIGSEGDTPRLHRMGGTEWTKAKAKAKASAEDIAEDLIKLYAKRKESNGFAYSPDSEWQEEFEETFPYEETPDQLMAIRDIKADMEKNVPMDRLLCGDVGFGKTEVAIRAAFKAVMDGKQVAVLVPTTVLAQQHYQNFFARFMKFSMKVDVICRFRSAKEQKATIEKTAEGNVDVLIGTHALLNSRKVKFKDLGLLIVDEEQRFGVKQKEKIKELSVGIDVLTLSATPIPRTLHMSLVGARDMSIIETPPAERFPVQTYVIESNESIIAGAIRRELKRGGQIYFIYNRVETIDRMRQKLEALVPEARIQTAHGQMPEDMLERVMMDFYQGEYDILLATSIVENGLDVSNANTIIVYNADYFGLSQLYQMRGRVGRSTRMAFAYFVYQRDKVLTETAEKRLQALKEFAELGAGFKIAMRDLEIRGAGNLLGSQQHGHIASVGFEMYCQLLNEAVQQLKTGHPVKVIPEPLIELAVEAYIDGGYIDDAMHKIEVYQRIAAIRNEEQISRLLDDLIDRFGEPSEPVMRLLEVSRVKNYARELGVVSMIQKGVLLELVLSTEHKISPENLTAFCKKMGTALKLLPLQQTLRIRMTETQKSDVLLFLKGILLSLAGEEKKPALRKGKH